jgi:uncharacterized heparinase superfamily protein
MWAEKASSSGIFRFPQQMLSHIARRAIGVPSLGLSQKWPGGEALEFRQPIIRLIPGDPATAEHLYATRFGKMPEDDFGRLTWLKHFAASGKTLHAIYAIDLLRDWADHYASVMTGEAAAKALLALTWDGPRIARRAGPIANALPLNLISRLTRATFNFHPRNDEQRLQRGAALLSVTAAVRGFDELRKAAHDDLTRGLNGLVLADGGHHTRRGDELLRILLTLMPIIRALWSAREPVPDGVHAAAEKMLPMLRMMIHADGSLSRLVDTKPHAEAVLAVLSADAVGGQPLDLAPYSGLARLNHGETLLIMDCFENAIDLSVGAEPLFVSTNLAMRSLSRPRAELETSDAGSVLRLLESGELRRSLYLSVRGDDLRCEDLINGGEAIELQIDPHVDIVPATEKEPVLLRARSGREWKLSARAATILIERQIIRLLPNLTVGDSRINWAVKRSHDSLH